MAILLNGSLCLTDLINQAKNQHSAFTKAKNGKIYFNFTQWVNDEADDYGNVSSVQLNSTKEKKESEGKVYVGNAKKAEAKAPEPISATDISELPEDDEMPF